MELKYYEKEHIEALRRLAPECTVLLKSNGDFPLSSPCSLALVGNGARRTIKGGTGSGDVNSRYYTTCEGALNKAGFEITTTSWLDAYDKEYKNAFEEHVKKMKAEAKKAGQIAGVYAMGSVVSEPETSIHIDTSASVCVYVLARNSGEGNDRKFEKGQVELTDSEVRDILFCQRVFKKFMLVLNVGAVVDLTPVDKVENILLLSQLGVVTGDVLADILLGRAYPSGKLTCSWASEKDYCHEGDFNEIDDTRYKEGIYVGYRFFDSVGKKARFPFGYGLSFTSFEIKPLSVKAEDSVITVSVSVKNTGKAIGREVVQLYMTAPWGKLDQPYQTLVGFSKTKSIMPGASEEVEISFNMADAASFDEFREAMVLENGNYILRVGSSSVDTVIAGVLKLEETIIVRKLHNILHEPDFSDFCPKNTWAEEDISAFEPIVIDTYAFAGMDKLKEAAASQEAIDICSKLSNEELCMLLIGDHPEKTTIKSVIGDSSKHVAGAAGETYDGIKGIEPIIMADGPAGLRISNTYYDKNGLKYTVGRVIPPFVMPYLPKAAALFDVKKAPRGVKVEHNFATALPIGTAIAQSFNTELARTCGDIVGSEMEIMGIDLWLAPGMNIQRNVLCGRNFEYFSEDPLITGLMAAAITEGVQSHPGKGVTIKHFCCNNQETNRYQNNSILSPRALRDIYLKGFEICINRANPMAIMTSYNLINGIHASEHSELLTTVVRNEWGYNGLIMTDWVIANMYNSKGKYKLARPSYSVLAGNDLFMPGSVANYDELHAAINRKMGEKVSREQLIYCASHVVDAVLKCKA